MDDELYNSNGYDDGNLGDQILELCKLAQGNLTTIFWCKQQIRERLKKLDRLVGRLEKVADENTKDKKRLKEIIKNQTDSCKELGDKIQVEIESLDAIRLAARSYGIDIKQRLLEMDRTLEDKEGFDDMFEVSPRVVIYLQLHKKIKGGPSCE